MNGIRALLGVIDRIALIAGALGAVCLALIPALILAEIGSVLLTGASLTFTWEYASFAMAAAFFLGLAYTLRAGGHVRVALVAEYLPPKGAWLLDILATTIALYFSGFITYALVQIAVASYVGGSLTFTATATPLYIPQSVMAFGGILLTLQLAVRVARLLIGEPPDLPPSSDIPTFEH